MLRSLKKINAVEYESLSITLQNNKPSPFIFLEFYKHKTYIGANFWWEKGEAEQRLLFIQKMIEINS